MKAAWRLVKQRFPHISCVGCTAHCLNLIFTVIFQISVFSDIQKKVSDVIKYIKRTHLALTHFKKLQKEKYGRITCTLKLPSKTRWSGAVIMLDFFMKNREALEALAITREFTAKREVKNVILDEGTWMRIDENIRILKPIADRILKSESNKCLLSEIPPLFQSLKNEVALELETNTTTTMNEKSIILDSISKRKEFCLQPIHFAANMLDPRYRGAELTDEEVITASDFISQLATYLKQNVAAVLGDLCDLKTKSGHFGRSETIWIPSNTVEPRIWWETFAHRRSINPIALRILSVPSSSAASERNWSTFGKIHNKPRNRLHAARVTKLVSIFSNLRLSEGSKGINVDSDEESDSDTSLADNIQRSSLAENDLWEQEDLDMQEDEGDSFQ